MKDTELGAIGHFNMGTFEGCGIGFGEGHAGNQPRSGISVPPPQTFNPPTVDADGWVKALKSFGAQRAVLVVSHGCGFNTFPSATKFPEFNFEYNYSVKNSPWKGGKGDIAADFIAACKKYDIRPGFYHGAMNNAFLNVRSGKVGSTTIPGQAKVTQAQYTQILLANLKQLWTSYGPLAEVWFDGGYPEGSEGPIAALLNETQPDAVAFQGPGLNVIRWAGTEGGHVKYPFWSTADSSLAQGAGSADGKVFAPGEADTCFQGGKYGEEGPEGPYGGCWFYNSGMVPKSLSQLVSTYHDSIGKNAFLLLDWSPSPNGTLRMDHVARYQEFGDWLRGCYSTPIAKIENQKVSLAGGKGVVTLTLPAADGGHAVDRVMITEDQTDGERIQGYTVSIQGTVVASGSSVGNKRIQLLDKPVDGTTEITLNITVANGGIATVASFSAFNCSRTPTPTGCSYSQDFAYKIVESIIITKVAGSTASKCCAVCQSHLNCAVFVLQSGECTLLSANQGGSAAAGTISGAPKR
jgi:alpha-L-fucosidase